MKRKHLVFFIVLTVFFSGVAGFAGTYIANSLSASTGIGYKESQSLSQYTSEVPSEATLSDYVSRYLNDNANLLGNSNPLDIYSLGSTNTIGSNNALTIPEITVLTSSSVVEIYTEIVASSGRMGQFITEGAGSGVIITSDGYIVTNNHVIDGARKITVLLKDGNEYEATLIGQDSKTDLAVIKISATGLQPAEYGDSDNLVVGELAIAIGNPLGQLGGTVSEGIISALSRNIDIDGETMTLLQTTAAVNPGNSGGGLFNSYGELIGVVNAKTSGYDIEGIGFAIPSNTVKDIAETIILHGYVPGRINFGATLVDVLDPRSAMIYYVPTIGVYVSQTDSDSVLVPGDRIISIDGTEITSSAEVKALLDAYNVGDILSIILARNGQRITVSLTLTEAQGKNL